MGTKQMGVRGGRETTGYCFILSDLNLKKLFSVHFNLLSVYSLINISIAQLPFLVNSTPVQNSLNAAE